MVFTSALLRLITWTTTTTLARKPERNHPPAHRPGGGEFEGTFDGFLGRGSRRAPSFGQGKEIGANRYEQFGGVQLFFYDEGAVRKEFGGHGLIEVREMMEPSGKDGARAMPFWVAVCGKE